MTLPDLSALALPGAKLAVRATPRARFGGIAPSRLTLLRGQTSRDALFQIDTPVGSR